MPREILNIDRLPENTCFGCGHHNPGGLRTKIWRADGDPQRIDGEWTPDENHCGFPGLVHGGLLYTVMDCVAAWTVNMLRTEKGAFWILRSASVKYHSPVRHGDRVLLSGTIEDGGEPWAPVLIRTECRREDGSLFVDGSYKMNPLTPDRLKGILGMDEIPANWRGFIAGP
ncbi:MAG: hotdog fold thioesterase [Candidatus Krumholzibacteria bacterium]|nr:hotdog fold thioesterase [Candidatus Krumholzibacteria bacterium]